MSDALRRPVRQGAGLLWWLVLPLALLFAGCGPKVVTMTAPGETAIDVNAIAVYPFQVQGKADPGLSYQKTVDLVAAAIEPRRFLVYSYGDFQLFTLDSLDAYEGRSLLATAREEGLDLGKLALLKGGVLFQALDGHASGGQPGHRAAETTDARVWVELYHYGNRQPLVRTESVLKLDPFEAGGHDPYPALTRQVRRLAAETMKVAMKRISAPPPHEALPLDFYADQGLFFKVASDDVPSIARKMLTMDDVDKSTELLRGYQYFYPDISLLQVTRLSTSPGLLITRIPGGWLAEQGLKEGDVLVKVNGTRVESAHQLDRQVARAGTAPLKLTVMRGGKETELEVKRP